jgi:hypothetical protein
VAYDFTRAFSVLTRGQIVGTMNSDTNVDFLYKTLQRSRKLRSRACLAKKISGRGTSHRVPQLENAWLMKIALKVALMQTGQNLFHRACG